MNGVSKMIKKSLSSNVFQIRPFKLVLAALLFALCSTSPGLTLAEEAGTAEIIAEFRRRLSNTASLKDYSTSASMRSDGTLIISGKTARQDDKDLILKIAREVPGVQVVQDNIVVYPSFGDAVYTDAEVTRNVKEALTRSNTPIPTFSVREGIVYLHGDFASFTQVDKTASVILSTEGVKDLKSDITVNGKDYLTSFQTEFKNMPR